MLRSKYQNSQTFESRRAKRSSAMSTTNRRTLSTVKTRRGHSNCSCVPTSANKLREKQLHPILRKLGIPRGGFHAARHGATSEMTANWRQQSYRSKMRHSDARITLGIYGHVVGDAQREEAVEEHAERIGEILSAVNQLEPSRPIGADFPGCSPSTLYWRRKSDILPKFHRIKDAFSNTFRRCVV